MAEEKEFMELEEAVRRTVFSPGASPETILRSSEMKAINNAKLCDLGGIIETTELKDAASDIKELPIPDKSNWEDLHSRLYKFLEELKKECRCHIKAD